MDQPPTPVPTATPLLFFSSRTARDNYFFCPRFRYLNGHWGPTGYGIQPQKQSIPLATGGRVHDVFKPILEWVRDHDAPPPESVVSQAAVDALTTYREDVRTKGLSYWQEGDAAFTQMIRENENLIVGLPMLWVTHQLPILLQDWRIVLVEPREVSVYQCTCGLGDGIPPWEAHVERACEGIGLQTGPDFVSQNRHAPDTYRYDEFKTRGGYLTDSWAEAFHTRVQIQLGTIGVEQKHGIQIEEVYLHGLSKGKYSKSQELGEYQDSRLCWAWLKPGEPPVSQDEWGYEYEWWEVDPETGANRKRRLGKGYKRAWVGDYPGGLPAWIQQLPEATVAKMLRTIGPIPRNPMAKSAALRGWIHLETGIRDNLRQIHEALATVGFDWTHDTVQNLLDAYFPHSWDCQRFGARYRCAMVPICHHEPGWQDPFSLNYVNRRPHHPIELQQAMSRGLLPAGETWEMEDE